MLERSAGEATFLFFLFFLTRTEFLQNAEWTIVGYWDRSAGLHGLLSGHGVMWLCSTDLRCMGFFK